MAPIRSYVVRVYRQGRDRIDGTIEDVNTGRSRPFHSIAELWEALRSRRRGGGVHKDAPPLSFDPTDPD